MAETPFHQGPRLLSVPQIVFPAKLKKRPPAEAPEKSLLFEHPLCPLPEEPPDVFLARAKRNGKEKGSLGRSPEPESMGIPAPQQGIPDSCVFHPYPLHSPLFIPLFRSGVNIT